MKFLTKLCAAGIVATLAIPMMVSAQAASTNPNATSKKAVLIANVNITASTLVLADNKITGDFTAMSSYGSQDKVQYGFVVRSKTSGVLLYASPSLGTLSLPDKTPKVQVVAYTVPAISEGGIVSLNLSNETGVVLATQIIGEASASLDKHVCTTTDTMITCKTAIASGLDITISDGGAQGKVILTKSVDLPANTKVDLSYADLTSTLSGGMYVISGVVTSNGAPADHFTKEYGVTRPRAKIMSLSLVPVGTDSVKAVVYTEIYGFASTTKFTLSFNASNCGSVEATPVAGSVTDLMLTTTCASGTGTVSLIQDGNIVDTSVSTFAFPQVAEAPKDNNMNATAGMIAGIVLLLIALVIMVMKRKGTQTPMTPSTPSTPNVTSTTPTSVSGAVVATALFIALTVSAAPHASAATYTIAGNDYFWFCAGGGSCSSSGDDQIMSTSGTVTVNTNANGSLNANQPYTVTVSQTNSNSLAGNGAGRWGVCYDLANKSDGIECDSTDVMTKVYVNKSPVNTVSSVPDAMVAAHVATQTLTFTAPASGSVILSFWQFPNTPINGVQCNPIWLSPTVKCNQGIDTETYDTVSMPVTSTPTVNVQFSLLQKMFSVFALSN